jgi:hypothetical protein
LPACGSVLLHNSGNKYAIFLLFSSTVVRLRFEVCSGNYRIFFEACSGKLRETVAFFPIGWRIAVGYEAIQLGISLNFDTQLIKTNCLIPFFVVVLS